MKVAKVPNAGPASLPKRNPSRKRFEAIHSEIRQRICLLRYPPGSQLSETTLAAEFGVSRTPIRRVLNRLEFEGLVESRHGVGTMVTVVDFDNLREVYALRMRLAQLIGELDPVSSGPEGIARLRALLDRANRLRQTLEPEEFARINMEFFHELSKVMGNGPLREVSERLYYQTTRIWLHAVPKMNVQEEVDVFAREIAETLDALLLDDLQALGAIRRAHISMSFNRLARYLASEEPTTARRPAATAGRRG